MEERKQNKNRKKKKKQEHTHTISGSAGVFLVSQYLWIDCSISYVNKDKRPGSYSRERKDMSLFRSQPQSCLKKISQSLKNMKKHKETIKGIILMIIIPPLTLLVWFETILKQNIFCVIQKYMDILLLDNDFIVVIQHIV